MVFAQVVQQALHGLRRLGDVLGGVLAPREFVRVAAAVVQALTERAVGARPGLTALRTCPLPFQHDLS